MRVTTFVAGNAPQLANITSFGWVFMNKAEENANAISHGPVITKCVMLKIIEQSYITTA